MQALAEILRVIGLTSSVGSRCTPYQHAQHIRPLIGRFSIEMAIPLLVSVGQASNDPRELLPAPIACGNAG